MAVIFKLGFCWSVGRHAALNAAWFVILGCLYKTVLTSMLFLPFLASVSTDLNDPDCYVGKTGPAADGWRTVHLTEQH